MSSVTSRWDRDGYPAVEKVIVSQSARRFRFLCKRLRQAHSPTTGFFCQRTLYSPHFEAERASTGHWRRYAALFAVTNANLMALARLNGSQAVAGSQPRPRGIRRNRRGTASRCVELGLALVLAVPLWLGGVGHGGGVWCPLGPGVAHGGAGLAGGDERGVVHRVADPRPPGVQARGP
jgi:hypothetical protein